MELNKRTSAHGEDGMLKFIQLCKENEITNVLDVGCGRVPYHTKIMSSKGLKVSTTDFFSGTTYSGDYNKLVLPKFDGIFCNHVLEHQLNVNSFLKKIYNDLNEGGILCVTVPPLKHKIVGGHVSLWNAGLILYNLVLAGFDCSDAHLKTYGYNISVVIKKKTAVMPKLKYDIGDMNSLNKYFPVGLVYNGGTFDGDIKEHNW